MAEVRFEHVYKSFDQVEIVHDVSLRDQGPGIPGAGRAIGQWKKHVLAHGRWAR